MKKIFTGWKKLLAGIFGCCLALSLAVIPVPLSAENGTVFPAELVNRFDSKTAFAGYVNASNTEVESKAHYTTDRIAVQAGDTVTFGPCNPSQDFHLHGYNSAGQIADSTVRANRLEVVDSFGSYVIYSYIVPAGVSGVRIANAAAVNEIFTVTVNQVFDTGVFAAYWSMGDRAEIAAQFGTYFPPRTDSALYQKSALFVGDSISCGSQESSLYYRAWAGRIGTVNSMDYVNASVSGASCSTTRSTNRIVTQLIANSDRNFDYVILHGGVNDAWDTVSVGTVSAGYSLSGFDTTTFAGGLEELFYYAVKEFRGAHIGYIMNFKAPNCQKGTVSNMDAYFAVAKQICEKWSIPYLNLYENDTFCDTVLKVTSTENLPDYIHPNASGYDLLYPVIESWMESLAVYQSEIEISDEVIEIRTEEELSNISKCQTGHYRLMNDIFLTGIWEPIPVFSGTLDGNGYSIVGLYVANAAKVNWGTAGLFGQTNGAVIKDLTVYGDLTNNIPECAVELGTFVGNAKNTQFLNCTSYVKISTGSASARVWAGGICGLAESGTVFQNCINYGSIQILNQTVAAYCYIGGICGQANNSTTFDGCVNNGAITAYPGGGNYAYVGGILGFAEYKAAGDTTLLTGCTNNAKLDATGVAGGILAFTRQHELIIRGCSNTADITCTTISAGILATAQTGTTYKDIVIENCDVYSLTEEPITILSSEAGSHSGGILAYLNARNVGFSITGCVNTANIVSNGLYAGGIVARANNAATKNITIGHCANTGDVTANGAGEVFIGGIVGRTQTTGGSVSYCYNGGEITAPNKTGGYIGGIAGSEGKLAYDYDFTATGVIFGYGNAAISKEGSKVLGEEDDLAEIAVYLNTDDITVIRVENNALVAVILTPAAPNAPVEAPEKPEPPVVEPDPPVEKPTEESSEKQDPEKPADGSNTGTPGANENTGSSEPGSGSSAGCRSSVFPAFSIVSLLVAGMAVCFCSKRRSI